MKRAAIAAVVLACLGCAKEDAPAANESAPASTGGGEAAASETAVAPEASSSLLGESWDEKLSGQLGESITVEGQFYGHDPEANCEYASTTKKRPAQTSWDWLIRKDGRCVVVTRGADPRAYNRILGQPDAILDRANIGRKVEITARVAADDAGRLYLEFAEGRPLN
jgi:hypothetical protein